MKKALQQLGFSNNEANIYLTLLKEKHLTAGQISKKTGINRRSTYDSLLNLEEKAYVGHNIEANKKRFFAMSPKVILEKIKDMEETAKELIPKLKKEQEPLEEAEVIIYKGKKGIRNILQLILQCKEYVSYGTSEYFPLIMEHDYDNFQIQKNKRKIKTRTILGEEIKKSKFLKVAEPATNFRFLSGKLVGPSSTFIFLNKVAIFIWEKPYFSILINSKNVHDSYLEYFEQLWKIAKK